MLKVGVVVVNIKVILILKKGVVLFDVSFLWNINLYKVKEYIYDDVN